MPIWPASTPRSNLRAVAPDWVKMAVPFPSGEMALVSILGYEVQNWAAG